MKRLIAASILVVCLVITAIFAWSVRANAAVVPLPIVVSLDTGIQTAHPYWHGQVISPGYVSPWTGSTTSVDDSYIGHGTLTSSAIDQFIASWGGDTSQPYLLPNKVCSTSGRCGDEAGPDQDGLALAIRWAADYPGVRVINASIYSYRYSQTIQDAINYATSKGVLVVSVAGNAACIKNSDGTPAHDPETVYPLAARDNMLVVGGVYPAPYEPVDSIYECSVLSSYVDVMGPAVVQSSGCSGPGIVNTPCNVTWQEPYGPVEWTGQPVTWSTTGTSMAAPQASALARLIFETNRQWCHCADDVAYVKGIIKSTTHPVNGGCPIGCGTGVMTPSAALVAAGWPPVPTVTATPTITSTPTPTVTPCVPSARKAQNCKSR